MRGDRPQRLVVHQPAGRQLIGRGVALRVQILGRVEEVHEEPGDSDRDRHHGDQQRRTADRDRQPVYRERRGGPEQTEHHGEPRHKVAGQQEQHRARREAGDGNRDQLRAGVDGAREPSDPARRAGPKPSSDRPRGTRSPSELLIPATQQGTATNLGIVPPATPTTTRRSPDRSPHGQDVPLGRGGGVGHPGRRVAGRRRLRVVRRAARPDRCAVRAGQHGSGDGVEQLRHRRRRVGGAAGRRTDQADHQFLRGGEQGVRPAVPARRAGAGADPAGHTGRAAARRRVGIPAFYTPAGVGTMVAEGGLPWRYHPDGSVAVASPEKEVREFDGQQYVLERGIVTDFALVHALFGDRHGNLVYARVRAQLQSAVRDGRPGHHRRGGAPRRARRRSTPTTSTPLGYSCTA